MFGPSGVSIVQPSIMRVMNIPYLKPALSLDKPPGPSADNLLCGLPQIVD